MTDWDSYVHYDCENCSEICINHCEAQRTRLRLCQECYQNVPETLLTAATSEGVRESPPSHGGPTERVSARPRAKRRGHSQLDPSANGSARGTRSLTASLDDE